jgi:hypothetical protein
VVQQSPPFVPSDELAVSQRENARPSRKDSPRFKRPFRDRFVACEEHLALLRRIVNPIDVGKLLSGD